MRRLVACFAVFLALTTCHGEPAGLQRRVIFVGLDGGDWQLLDRFIGDGTMPNLRAMVGEGDRRIVRTEHPPLSPLVWTTMMTGVGPLEHRILDFTRFNPVSRQKEPITSDERAVPAIWNMVSAQGGRVAVFGLWATYPAEQVNGTIVSDRLFSYQYDAPPPPGSVSPAAEEGHARETLRSIDAATGFEAVHAYVPALTSDEYAAFAADPPFAHPETALRRILVETEVIHRLATERIAKERPTLAVVYFQGTDAIGHLFGPYYPPNLATVDDKFLRYRAVPRRYFARIDALLGDYRKLAEEMEADLVIASDHGFLWGGGGAPASSLAAATAAKWHRDEGIYLHWQPQHLRQRSVTMHLPSTIVPARELCPTLLEILGLPHDVASYRRAYRAQAARPSSGDPEAIAKLKALGYLGGGEPSQAPAGSTGTRTAASFNNEALLLSEAGHDDAAVAAFENALRVDPSSAAAMWNLSELLRKQHRDDARAATLLDGALALDPGEPRWLLTRGRMRLERSDCAGALADFARATALTPNDPLAHASAATAHLCLGHQQEGRKEIERSLALDPNQPALRRALASN